MARDLTDRLVAALERIASALEVGGVAVERGACAPAGVAAVVRSEGIAAAATTPKARTGEGGAVRPQRRRPPPRRTPAAVAHEPTELDREYARRRMKELAGKQ